MADLTTIQNVRRQLFGNDPSLEADGILEALITSSSAWVENDVGGDLIRATVTETRDGDGGTKLRLLRSHSWRPAVTATTVTSVTVDGMVIPARAAVTSLNTNPSGWLFRDDCVELVGYTFTSGVANVVVVYAAGYTTCPTDVEQACLEHIALRYRDRGHVGIDSSSGDVNVNYGNAGTLAFIDGVLTRYRVEGIA
jgi:hypothetical protein